MLALAYLFIISGSVFCGSEGYFQSPSSTTVLPPIGGRAPIFGIHGKSPGSNAPGPISPPKGSPLPVGMVLPPKMGPLPLTIHRPVASVPAKSPSHHISKEHKHSKGTSPSMKNHISHLPIRAGPIISPLRESPRLAPAAHPSISRIAPTITSGPSVPSIPTSPPTTNGKGHTFPFAAPPMEIFNRISPSNRIPTEGSSPIIPPAPQKALKPPSNASPGPIPLPKTPVKRRVHSPASSPSIFFHKHHVRKGANIPASVPSNPSPPSNHRGPAISPYHSHPPAAPQKKSGQRPDAPPSMDQGPSPSPMQSSFSPTRKQGHPAPSPSPSPSSTLPSRPSERAPSPSPSSTLPSRPSERAPSPSPSPTLPSRPSERAPSPSPSPSSTLPSRPSERAPSPLLVVPSTPAESAPSPLLTVPSRPTESSPSPSPSLTVPSKPIKGPAPSPTVSPAGSSPSVAKVPVAPPVRALPPPPPNLDCSSLTCNDPLTNTPPGSPCECVLPIQVGLSLGVALYTFFPLVSELALEIANGVFMKQSQVRIMGANAASQDPDKTIVLIDLVPLGKKFDNTTAFLTYERFWHKQVIIKMNFFGDYRVLYVKYPGLPPSPPSSPSSINANEGQLPNENNSRTMHPLGVDVRKKKEKLSSSIIAVMVLSSFIALILFVGAIWLLLWKRGVHTRQPLPTLQVTLPPPKPSGAGSTILGSWPSSAASASLSLSSSIVAYTGSAKTFSIGEIEKATNNFDTSKILGEGGFGRVYRGILEDGTKVAVKVLKRDDQQGSREFLAEVEMLSRLHHRNLVKLIGICTEEHCRCLVYELIPNGSVDSHLHGVDKESTSLDWGARVKIALGSARGLAYLHEDSSPRVIHRDFKSSNILLEYDFTPKVSDFGLARTALEGGNEHISTRVMGTFGYVAPEYAMTGHLLVKSDVYSYGVVLLELLTGRKPVDMSRPLGQENLVTWARPFLTSKEGLEMIIDPCLGSDFPFDSVAKVAAIASMCVQPEVSHRPFMGEVVQALKLVCNESDEIKTEAARCSQEDSSVHDASGQPPEARSFTDEYDSGLEADRALSTSDVFSSSARFMWQETGSCRRHSRSGPLTTGKDEQNLQRSTSRGSVSEHGIALKLWEVLDSVERWP